MKSINLTDAPAAPATGAASCCSHGHGADQSVEAARSGGDSTESIDPVCGMTVTPDSAAGSVEHNGTRYYFCNPSCLERFTANPDEFLSPEPARAVEPTPPGTQYFCPMDPEASLAPSRPARWRCRSTRCGARRTINSRSATARPACW
jgi:Cu+-exporting ATPase